MVSVHGHRLADGRMDRLLVFRQLADGLAAVLLGLIKWSVIYLNRLGSAIPSAFRFAQQLAPSNL